MSGRKSAPQGEVGYDAVASLVIILIVNSAGITIYKPESNPPVAGNTNSPMAKSWVHLPHQTLALSPAGENCLKHQADALPAGRAYL